MFLDNLKCRKTWNPRNPELLEESKEDQNLLKKEHEDEEIARCIKIRENENEEIARRMKIKRLRDRLRQRKV